eukprot:COSAG01_NODE_15188_length_1363_cov_6.749209_1_plen_63_part_10
MGDLVEGEGVVGGLRLRCRGRGGWVSRATDDGRPLLRPLPLPQPSSSSSRGRRGRRRQRQQQL